MKKVGNVCITQNKAVGVVLTIVGAPKPTTRASLTLKELDKLIEALTRTKQDIKKLLSIGDLHTIEFKKIGWTDAAFEASIAECTADWGEEPKVFELSEHSYQVDMIPGAKDFASATVIVRQAYEALYPVNEVHWDITQPEFEDIYDGYEVKWFTFNKEEARRFEPWLWNTYTRPFLVENDLL